MSQHFYQAEPTKKGNARPTSLPPRVNLLSEFLRGFDDARGVYDRVREYYGNPWDRVSREMAKGIEMVEGTANDDQESEPLDEDEGRELAELLLSQEHGGPEVQALLEAWKGSIQHIGTPGMASLPFNQFMAVLEHISSACQVPSAPTHSETVQTPQEMMDTVARLQREGRMPSLDQLLAAMQGATEEDEEPPAKKRKKK